MDFGKKKRKKKKKHFKNKQKNHIYSYQRLTFFFDNFVMIRVILSLNTANYVCMLLCIQIPRSCCFLAKKQLKHWQICYRLNQTVLFAGSSFNQHKHLLYEVWRECRQRFGTIDIIISGGGGVEIRYIRSQSRVPGPFCFPISRDLVRD